MKKSLLIFISLLTFYNSYSQVKNVLDSVCSIGMENFISNNNEYQFFYNKNKIPKQIKKNISEWSGRKFRIANLGKGYQFDDEKRFLIPDKRLVLFAQNKDYLILIYDRGGIAPNRIMHIWQKNRDDIFCEFYIPPYETIDALFNYLRTEKLRLTPY